MSDQCDKMDQNSENTPCQITSLNRTQSIGPICHRPSKVDTSSKCWIRAICSSLRNKLLQLSRMLLVFFLHQSCKLNWAGGQAWKTGQTALMNLHIYIYTYISVHFPFIQTFSRKTNKYRNCASSNEGLVASFTSCTRGWKILKFSFESTWKHCQGNSTMSWKILTKSLHTKC